MATTPNIDNKRYQGLIISIALFLSLIGALLAFTFYTSSLLERNTALIDQTNQVANSAQSVIKDLFDLDNSYGEDTSSPHIQRVL
ncbi:MAG: ATP-binding protein, partial [Moraxellaceae bacterium]